MYTYRVLDYGKYIQVILYRHSKNPIEWKYNKFPFGELFATWRVNRLVTLYDARPRLLG